jgi:hypothetical protein
MPTDHGRLRLVEDQMNRPTKPNPKTKPNDTDEMREAIYFLASDGVNFSRPTHYQLKIGDLSFYPDTGRIFRDGECEAWEQRGLEVFIFHIRKLKKQTGNVVRFPRDYDTDLPLGLDLSGLCGDP